MNISGKVHRQFGLALLYQLVVELVLVLAAILAWFFAPAMAPFLVVLSTVLFLFPRNKPRALGQFLILVLGFGFVGPNLAVLCKGSWAEANSGVQFVFYGALAITLGSFCWRQFPKVLAFAWEHPLFLALIGPVLAVVVRCAFGADYDTTKLLLSLSLALVPLSLCRRLIPALLAWAWARPLQFGLIGLVLAIVYRAGAEYGLPDLFWHDDWRVQLLAGFSVALLFALIVVGFLAAEPGLAELQEPARATGAGARETVTEAPQGNLHPLAPESAVKQPGTDGSDAGPTAARPGPDPSQAVTAAAGTEADAVPAAGNHMTRAHQPAPPPTYPMGPSICDRDAFLKLTQIVSEIPPGPGAGDFWSDLARPIISTPRKTHRVHFSNEVISDCLGSLPRWVQAILDWLGSLPGCVRRKLRRKGSPEDAEWPDLPFALMLVKVSVPLSVLLLLLIPPAVVSVVDRFLTRFEGLETGPVLGDLALPFGALGGAIALVFALCLIRALHHRLAKYLQSEFVYLPLWWLVSLLAGLILWRSTAAMAICTLLGSIAVILFITSVWYSLLPRNASWWSRLLVIVIFLGYVAFANGSDPYKLSYPHLTLAPLDQPVLYNPPDERAKAKAEKAQLLPDCKALSAWLDRQKTAWPGRKPRLAVVAVSGGGIVAAVWTARVLKALEEGSDRFPGAVRVVTGASGGMLGAASFVASLLPPEDGKTARHTAGELDKLLEGLQQDCLSPVARQMATLDLMTILMPGRLPKAVQDRGLVLEETWEQNLGQFCPSAGAPMKGPSRALRDGEREGWRPSLIFSPMIVEDTAPMLISNLDLHKLDPKRAEFFKKFADEPAVVEADQLKLSTAVRMNAAFPLVSPAVYLPTNPPKRLVDAGYYDNYGVSTAAAWLTSNLDWLADHTGGVVLIQIRAYPDAVPTVQPEGFWNWIPNSIQWLTTPLEGFTAAGRRVMIDRNKDLIAGLDRAFKATHKPDFSFETVELECRESVPLSWYLTQKDKKKLELCARTDKVSQAQDRKENGGERCDKYHREFKRVVIFLAAFDLRLMPSLNDESGIPKEGKDLIIVAAVNDVLHFRIFDRRGNVVVDTDEKKLTEQAWQIEDLRKQLQSLWPPRGLTRSDEDRVVSAVTSIVGHSLLAEDGG